ncbi:MAG TPA: cupredoxin domain-containing protein [Nitrosopumilaceae archaeon]|nr:cupredoxin domain-containing protein [Nitrosopumilaceae archaeon]
MTKASIVKTKIGKKTIIGITLMALLVAGGGYYAILSMIPVNGTFPVFGSPTNVFIKSIKSQDKGYVFASQSIKGGKTPPVLGKTSPTYLVEKGNLVSIHFINEDKNMPNMISKHNLNIDEFNVHSKDLGYFQTDTITFLADKKGTFDYYCSIHPGMRGEIIVE